MSEQRKVAFQELIDEGVLEIGDGYRAKLNELGGGGPIFLRAGSLTERGFQWDGNDRFSKDLAAKLQSKIGVPGDVVITTKGNSIGRSGYVAKSAPDFIYSPHLSYWRALDSRVLHSGYLYYWSRCKQFTNQLHALAFGTDMAPYFSLTDQKRLKMTLPPLERQRAVAVILQALDDKVAVNNRIAATAETLRSIRFQNFLTTVPEGANKCPLSSLASFVNGRAYTRNATGTGRMVVRIAELNSGPGNSTVYNEIEVPDENVARPGDILFAWSGSLTISRWFRSDAIVNQHIFKVLPKGGLPHWLLYEILKRQLTYFRGIAAGKATTMGHIQRRHLDEPVSIPSESYVHQLDAELRPLWERALLAERESLSLTQLRDSLLPKLMSGEVRIRDAEMVVEDAV